MTSAISVADKVAFLSHLDAYPGDSGPVDVIETHMSWVFLTDRHAYKMKKPMRQERLDFSTLERRRHFCEEELRLNRRLAPDVYLGTVPLAAGFGSVLILGGPGDVVEWLVKMRRLPDQNTLGAMLIAGKLRRDDVQAVVEVMVGLYARTPPERLTEVAYRRRFRIALTDTERELRRTEFGLPADVIRRVAERLSRFIAVEGRRLDSRVQQGRIVEGHGDLRPVHIYIKPELLIIDCLEFDRDLRLADPADELAFLAMECDRLAAPHVGGWLFKAYGDATGDWPPDDLVAFHKGCRAFQRAKLAIWHLDEPDCHHRDHWRGRAHDYLELAANNAERLL